MLRETTHFSARNVLATSYCPADPVRPLRAPQVGISSVWYEGNPCNMHLMDLAAEVKKGVEAVGLVGYR